MESGNPFDIFGNRNCQLKWIQQVTSKHLTAFWGDPKAVETINGIMFCEMEMFDYFAGRPGASGTGFNG